MRDRVKEKILLYRVITRKDPDAFAELYDTHVERVYRFVFFKLSNKEEAEDVTSDVFLRTWNYLIEGTVQEVSSFTALIYRVARNAIVDVYRDRTKRPEHSFASLTEGIEDIGVVDQPLTGIETRHDLERVMSAVKKLKQEYQEVLLLRYIEELSVAEMAELLQKGKTNVRVTLHRAMRVLKKILLK